ncbi:MAG: RNA methyltransferase [Alphaproteobacteria bacterium]|nr:RNA methyltransferase [Alphaproteobacteria bacterium]
MNRLSRARPAGRAERAAPVGAEAVLAFGEIGARGDAAARHNDRPVYAPFLLPGEEARVRVLGERAELMEILQESAERQGPVCPHFGRCGGCQLQHWREGPYLGWKRELVVKAMARRGVEAEVLDVVPAWGVGRRRAAFHAERARRGVALGFVERGGARITPIEACPVLTRNLQTALPAVRKVAELFAPPRGEASLTCLDTDAGVDVNVKGAGRALALDRARLEAAVDIADVGDLARLSIDGDQIIQRRQPMLTMGDARVTPPPGAFVQATRAGEDALAERVVAALGGAGRVADLFSGCGTFALRIAAFAPVHALEGDAAMLEALKHAADGAGGALRDVTTQRRDLLRTPFSALELKHYDAVVLDPPRAGARLQTQQIAASKVSRVASVSCDPATFARDARILIDAGFALGPVTPIDQFRYTAHVEVVGVFTR